MNKFLEFLTQNSVDIVETVFLMLFSLGIALFQTLIFSGLFNLKFPNWLFFILSPAIVGISYLINPAFPLAAMFLLFISVNTMKNIKPQKKGVICDKAKLISPLLIRPTSTEKIGQKIKTNNPNRRIVCLILNFCKQ